MKSRKKKSRFGWTSFCAPIDLGNMEHSHHNRTFVFLSLLLSRSSPRFSPLPLLPRPARTIKFIVSLIVSEEIFFYIHWYTIALVHTSKWRKAANTRKKWNEEEACEEWTKNTRRSNVFWSWIGQKSVINWASRFVFAFFRFSACTREIETLRTGATVTPFSRNPKRRIVQNTIAERKGLTAPKRDRNLPWHEDRSHYTKCLALSPWLATESRKNYKW